MMETSIFSSIDQVIFDFDGVFTNNTVLVDQSGSESVRCWRSDGLGLSRLKDIGVKTMILSTEKNNVVRVRAEKLKIPCLSGIDDKAGALRRVCLDSNISLERTMFVGNDINDIPALRIVGLPAAVADAYPEVFQFVQYVTKKQGGYGAVREICDLIYWERVGVHAN